MEHFTYIPTLSLLACKTCQVIILGDHIQRHLKHLPHNATPAEIELAIKWAQSFDHIQNIKGLNQLPYPIPLGPPIPELGEARGNGFKCTFSASCHQVCCSLVELRRHLRSVHQQSKQRGQAGRPPKATAQITISPSSSQPWRSGVFYQRLFQKGHRSEYFEVDMHQSLTEPSDQTDLFAAFQAQALSIRQKEAGLMEQPDQFTQPQPWLDRLGSVNHLRDFADQKDFLRGLISPTIDLSSTILDDTSNLGFVFILRALDRLIWEAQGQLYRQEIPFMARFEVNRFDANTANRKPFSYSHKQETKRRYAQVVKQLMLYALRCLELDDPARRPPFKVSNKQKNAYDSLMEISDDIEDYWKQSQGDLSDQRVIETFDRLKEATLRFFMSLLCQHAKDAEHDCLMVSFLTVLSIAPDGTWHGFGILTPWLSAIVSISRLLILREAHLIRSKEVDQKVANGLSIAAAQESAPGILKLVEHRTSQCMLSSTAESEATPMQYIFRLRSYGIAANANSASPGSLTWDGLDIIYKGIRLPLQNLSTLQQSIVDAARLTLFQDLLFQQDYSLLDDQPALLPPIPWDSIQDNAREETLGYSFLESLYQAAGESTRTWAIAHIWNRPELRARWYGRSKRPDTAPDSQALSAYAESIDQMLEHLTILIHLGGGLPARSTEILTLRHRNTAPGGTRNIFIDRGMVMLVTGIHKGLSRSQRLRVVHRFLPREVGTLLVYYLWLVLPFAEAALANIPSEQVRTFSPFLWGIKGLAEVDDPSGSYAYKATDQMLQGLRLELGYTQGNEKRQARPRVMDDSPQTISLSPRNFTPARMSRTLQRWGATIGVEILGISSWRHIAVAIGRRFIRDASITSQGFYNEVDNDDSDDEASDQEGIGEKDTIVNEQTGHTAWTSGMVYGRGLQEANFETYQRRESFRQLSQQWHYLLGFPSALQVSSASMRSNSKRSGAHIDTEQFQELQAIRWKQLRRVDLALELKRLLGSNAIFRPGQELIMRAIMHNKSPIVAIMPTGSGKSLLFQLPAASCPGGVTVVIVPLVSLQGNLCDRTREMNIAAAQWRSNQTVGNARIIFVTPETALTKHFLTYLDVLQSQAQLDRIVVDECHTILEGNFKFRPKLRELGLLAQRGVQMVYLTATLAIADEPSFFRLINCDRKDATVFRNPTSRPNIRYGVISIDIRKSNNKRDSTSSIIRALIDQKLGTYASSAKAIVYCPSRSATEGLAEDLGCDAYYSDISTADGKAERLRAWMQGGKRDLYQRGQVIVATNALGLGIDVPNIRLIIHLEMPRRIADYSQQSGRAGRDGLPSEAIVIVPKREPTDQMRFDQLIDPAGRAFLSGSQCRRIALDVALDGRQGRSSCEYAEERCDYCLAHPPQRKPEGQFHGEDEQDRDLRLRQVATQSTRDRIAAWARDQQVEFNSFKQHLQRQQLEGCIYCRLLDAGPSDHSPEKCTVVSNCARHELLRSQQQALSLKKFLQQRKKIEDFGACFQCMLPQELCRRWEEDLDGNWQQRADSQCQYPGIILSTFACALSQHDNRMGEIIQEEGYLGQVPAAGSTRDEHLQLWAWLGERIKWARVDSIRLCHIYFKIKEEILY